MYGAKFAGKPIERFADDFISPVVLVGPENSKQYYLNSRAALLSYKLGISSENQTKSENIEV